MLKRSLFALGSLIAGPCCWAEMVYVTNEMSGDLTVIDGAKQTVVATIPLGKRPRGIRASPDGKLLYVALSGSPIAGPGVDESTLPPADKSADGIGVVDVATHKVIRVLKGISDPEQLDVSYDGRRLYVASEDTGTALVFDAQSGKVLANVTVGGEPEGVTLSPDGSVVYVTSEEGGIVSLIDTKTNRLIKQLKVGQRPRAAAFAPDGSRAYVTGENDASVTVIDARKHEVIQTIKLPGDGVRPMGVLVSPTGRWVYVATGRGRKVLAIDATTLKVSWEVTVGERPWGVAVSPDGARIYSANGPSNDVTIVDARSRKVIATLPAGTRPWGILAVRGR